MSIIRYDERKVRIAVANAILDGKVEYKRDVSLFSIVIPQVEATLATIDWQTVMNGLANAVRAIDYQAIVNAVAVAAASSATKAVIEKMLEEKEKEQ